MKVLIISTSLLGGAGGATYRLHEGLQTSGVFSQVLVESKQGDDEAVIAVAPSKSARLLKILGRMPYVGELDRLPLRFYRQRERKGFSIQWRPERLAALAAQMRSDLINIHWIGSDFLRIETLRRFSKPIVWTLHDMWAFTGGCYYAEDCDRYQESCGVCPQLRSRNEWDVSRWVWHRKAKAWKNLNFTVVTPSSWLAQCARSSSLLRNQRIEVIPYGIDTQKFKPMNRFEARKKLNLPQDKHLVLFGVWRPNRPWKGFHLLQSALKDLASAGWRDKMELIVFGLDPPNIRPDLNIKVHYLGKLTDDASLVTSYAAADVSVAPSLQDNLPNAVIEALSCGLPCVAFNIGGMPDLIHHYQNGYLARPYEVEDLARGIAWVLEDDCRRHRLSQFARERAEAEFSLERYTSRYLALFREIVHQQNSKIAAL